MKTRFTDLLARTALGLQLVSSIFENIAYSSKESLDPPLVIDRYIYIYIYMLRLFLRWSFRWSSELFRQCFIPYAVEWLLSRIGWPFPGFHVLLFCRHSADIVRKYINYSHSLYQNGYTMARKPFYNRKKERKVSRLSLYDFTRKRVCYWFVLIFLLFSHISFNDH